MVMGWIGLASKFTILGNLNCVCRPKWTFSSINQTILSITGKYICFTKI
jgi:hypothetical protein